MRMPAPTFFSKDDLITRLRELRDRGWIPSRAQPGNDGAVGNTLEDLLGIEENNLPIPNAAEWELKAQRESSASLTTLFHMEPSPLGAKIVPSVLLPVYGWKHQKAGGKYPESELSFRSTTPGNGYTDRGFKVDVDRVEKKVKFSFNAGAVDRNRHSGWLEMVKRRAGLNQIVPQPYWGFDDLRYKAGTKLKNAVYMLAENRVESGKEYFRFVHLKMLTRFDFDKFLNCLENGIILIDFDARTGHNHGTKFRLKQNQWPALYFESVEIF
jgi:hypothetical protein